MTVIIYTTVPEKHEKITPAEALTLVRDHFTQNKTGFMFIDGSPFSSTETLVPHDFDKASEIILGNNIIGGS
jgi:hypothetical protein